jgi:uncharacterized protein (DUF488 family)
VKLLTIGFTKKSAEDFFELLRTSGTKRVVDVRLNNVSQLAGFTKRQDLAYFLETICGIEYVHQPLLAPTQEMLDEFRKAGTGWDRYEQRFIELMRERRIEDIIDPKLIADGCLLCSEEKPHHCHRRIVAEYLKQHWGEVEIEHLEGRGKREQGRVRHLE